MKNTDKNTNMKAQVMDTIHLTLLLFSVLLIVVGIIGPIIMLLIVSNAPKVEAEIIGFEQVNIDGGDESFKPKFKFTYKQKEYTETSIFGSNPKAYKIGEKVEVFLMIDNPEKAEINNFKTIYFMFVASLVTGIILAVISKKISAIEQK